VIASGDLLDLTEYALIDPKASGSIQAILDSLIDCSEVAVPSAYEQGGTLVIPGHGRIAGFANVVYYRNMVSIIRDRIQNMIKKGMMLEQVKAARPTLDHDARCGSAGGKGPRTSSSRQRTRTSNLEHKRERSRSVKTRILMLERLSWCS